LQDLFPAVPHVVAPQVYHTLHFGCWLPQFTPTVCPTRCLPGWFLLPRLRLFTPLPFVHCRYVYGYGCRLLCLLVTRTWLPHHTHTHSSPQLVPLWIPRFIWITLVGWLVSWLPVQLQLPHTFGLLHIPLYLPSHTHTHSSWLVAGLLQFCPPLDLTLCPVTHRLYPLDCLPTFGWLLFYAFVTYGSRSSCLGPLAHVTPCAWITRYIWTVWTPHGCTHLVYTRCGLPWLPFLYGLHGFGWLRGWIWLRLVAVAVAVGLVSWIPLPGWIWTHAPSPVGFYIPHTLPWLVTVTHALRLDSCPLLPVAPFVRVYLCTVPHVTYTRVGCTFGLRLRLDSPGWTCTFGWLYPLPHIYIHLHTYLYSWVTVPPCLLDWLPWLLLHLWFLQFTHGYSPYTVGLVAGYTQVGYGPAHAPLHTHTFYIAGWLVGWICHLWFTHICTHLYLYHGYTLRTFGWLVLGCAFIWLPLPFTRLQFTQLPLRLVGYTRCCPTHTTLDSWLDSLWILQFAVAHTHVYTGWVGLPFVGLPLCTFPVGFPCPSHTVALVAFHVDLHTCGHPDYPIWLPLRFCSWLVYIAPCPDLHTFDLPHVAFAPLIWIWIADVALRCPTLLRGYVVDVVTLLVGYTPCTVPTVWITPVGYTHAALVGYIHTLWITQLDYRLLRIARIAHYPTHYTQVGSRPLCDPHTFGFGLPFICWTLGPVTYVTFDWIVGLVVPVTLYVHTHTPWITRLGSHTPLVGPHAFGYLGWLGYLDTWVLGWILVGYITLPGWFFLPCYLHLPYCPIHVTVPLPHVVRLLVAPRCWLVGLPTLPFWIIAPRFVGFTRPTLRYPRFVTLVGFWITCPD